jgi:hypothetical protein
MSSDDGESDDADDKTPPHGIPIPYSGTRLNLLEVAAAANEVVRSLHRASRKVDSVSGLARHSLCSELADQLDEIGLVFRAVASALRDEAGLPPRRAKP